MLKRGILKQEDLNGTPFAQERHDFGELLYANDYGSDKSDNHGSSCDDYTDYSTDEVHDTRSYFIGYYRGPKKDNSDDSETEEFYKSLLNKPELA